jgi:MscS family membrane protein
LFTLNGALLSVVFLPFQLLAADDPVPPAPKVPAALQVPAEKAVEEVENHLPDRWRWLTDYSLASNELWRIVALFASILILLLIGRLLRMGLNLTARRLAASRKNVLAAAATALGRAMGFVSFALGLGIGVQFLRLEPALAGAVQPSVSVLFVIAVGYCGYCLVDAVEEWLLKLSGGNVSRLDVMLAPLVTTSLRLTVVVLALMQVATILSGKPVTAVIAGLGVGGLAIGLAAQDTIKNFFGSLMIFSDRPFELGDEIKIDATGGSVESVGFRSTRFRTADGFLVTIPNGELASKTIVNISKRRSLNRQFNLALSYELSPDKVERALAIVKEILHDHEGSDSNSPPRVFLSDFAPSALNLSVAYWYAPTDWWRFVAFNERVNFEILRRFAAEDITLAFPTQTIRLKTDPAPQGPDEHQ